MDILWKFKNEKNITLYYSNRTLVRLSRYANIWSEVKQFSVEGYIGQGQV